MGLRKRRERKRGNRPDARAGEDAAPDDGDADDRRQDATRPSNDELESRLDAVAPRFAHPPSPEELRAAFRRKPVEQHDEPRNSFSSSYTAESLFVPTADDVIEPEPSQAEDRSRTKGDYYYDPDDAWGVLGIQPGASWAEIAAAHRKLAMKHHPDRLLGSTEEERQASEDKMREINVAYSVLRRLTGN